MRFCHGRQTRGARRLPQCIPISLLAEGEGVMSHISAHADYRHEDYFFNRTQSRGLNALEWVHSDKPLRSWSNLLYPALAAAGAVAAVLEVLH
jgi:hypothetical protein